LTKYIQISIFLLAAIYGSEPITHSVSLEYGVTEKFKLFSLKDIISIEIEGKDIEIKPEGLGKSFLEKTLDYRNQNLSNTSLLNILLIKKVVPVIEDDWISDLHLLDDLTVKARFLFSKKIDEKRVYRLDIKQLNKQAVDNRVNVVILGNDIIKVWTDEKKNIIKISFTYKSANYIIDMLNEK